MEDQNAVVSLTEEEVGKLRDKMQKIRQLSDAMAGLTFEYEARKASILSGHQVLQQEIQQLAEEFVTSYNLDKDKQWAIDFEKGTIQLAPQAQQ
jgi:predicted Ser/Thr protein kinase